jgi:hypothetical protein
MEHRQRGVGAEETDQEGDQHEAQIVFLCHAQINAHERSLVVPPIPGQIGPRGLNVALAHLRLQMTFGLTIAPRRPADAVSKRVRAP